MKTVDTIAALEALYEPANVKSLEKVVTRLTPAYRAWIEASRFVIVSTVGPEGTDGSPRGDDGPVVRIADDRTLMLPDWRGNNRLDTLRNIVADGRVSLMFIVRGSDNVVRVNGTAKLIVDETLCESFAKNGIAPRSVIAVRVAEAYFQCAKALMRSRLWTQDPVEVPSAGDFLREQIDGFDARTYDEGYAEHARAIMW